jgi:hypothetical protein
VLCVSVGAVLRKACNNCVLSFRFVTLSLSSCTVFYYVEMTDLTVLLELHDKFLIGGRVT